MALLVLVEIWILMAMSLTDGQGYDLVETGRAGLWQDGDEYALPKEVCIGLCSVENWLRYSW